MTDSLLTVTVVRAQPGVTLELTGELDLSSVPILEGALEGIDPGVEQVTLDLAGLTFLDSSGLNVFANTRVALRSEGCELVLRAPRPTVLRTLTVAGLADVFDLADEVATEDAATTVD